MYKLEQWSICSANKGDGRLIPPDAERIALQARFSDRPGFEDGIVTTAIVEIHGRVVRTKSGTEYLLGEPDPDYVIWCRERGLHDPTNEEMPIRKHVPAVDL